MTSDELLGYIHKCRESDFSEDDIRSVLNDAGYPPQVIEDALFSKTPLTDAPPFYEEEREPHIVPSKHEVFGEIPFKEGFFSRVVQVIRHTSDFFENLQQHEMHAFRALSHFFLGSAFFIGTLFGVLYLLFSTVLESFLLDQGLFTDELLVASLVVIVVLLFMHLVLTVVWHGIARLFGGHGSLGQSTQIAVYSVLPVLVFGCLQ